MRSFSLFGAKYPGFGMNSDGKIAKGILMLQEQGHQVEPYALHGKEWWQIDSRMLATPEEIEHIADGVYSLDELVELFTRRRRDEAG